MPQLAYNRQLAHGILGRDRLDRPVLYIHLGRFSISALTRAGADMQVCLRYNEWLTERLAFACSPPHVGQWIVILDLHGISFSRLASAQMMMYVQAFIAHDALHYADRLAYLACINVPSFFETTWNIIRRWVDEEARERVHLYAAHTWRDALTHVFDLSILPKHLGGLGTLSLRGLDPAMTPLPPVSTTPPLSTDPTLPQPPQPPQLPQLPPQHQTTRANEGGRAGASEMASLASETEQGATRQPATDHEAERYMCERTVACARHRISPSPSGAAARDARTARIQPSTPSTAQGVALGARAAWVGDAHDTAAAVSSLHSSELASTTLSQRHGSEAAAELSIQPRPSVSMAAQPSLGSPRAAGVLRRSSEDPESAELPSAPAPPPPPTSESSEPVAVVQPTGALAVVETLRHPLPTPGPAPPRRQDCGTDRGEADGPSQDLSSGMERHGGDGLARVAAESASVDSAGSSRCISPDSDDMGEAAVVGALWGKAPGSKVASLEPHVTSALPHVEVGAPSTRAFATLLRVSTPAPAEEPLARTPAERSCSNLVASADSTSGMARTTASSCVRYGLAGHMQFCGLRDGSGLSRAHSGAAVSTSPLLETSERVGLLRHRLQVAAAAKGTLLYGPSYGSSLNFGRRVAASTSAPFRDRSDGEAVLYASTTLVTGAQSRGNEASGGGLSSASAGASEASAAPGGQECRGASGDAGTSASEGGGGTTGTVTAPSWGEMFSLMLLGESPERRGSDIVQSNAETRSLTYEQPEQRMVTNPPSPDENGLAEPADDISGYAHRWLIELGLPRQLAALVAVAPDNVTEAIGQALSGDDDEARSEMEEPRMEES